MNLEKVDSIANLYAVIVIKCVREYNRKQQTGGVGNSEIPKRREHRVG